MSLADRLATPPAPKGSPLDVWIASLPKKDQEAVTAAVNDPQWRHIDLQRVLESEGAPKMAERTFGTWRNKRVTK